MYIYMFIYVYICVCEGIVYDSLFLDLDGQNFSK